MIKFRVKVVKLGNRNQYFLQVLEGWFDYLFGHWKTLGYVNKKGYDRLPEDDEGFSRYSHEQCKRAAEIYFRYHHMKTHRLNDDRVTYMECNIFDEEKTSD